MIGKLGIDSARSIDISEISTSQEDASVQQTTQKEEVVSHTAQEQMFATERKQSFAFTGTMNRSALDAQLTALVKTEKPVAAVGAKSPDEVGIAAAKTLRPGSSGEEVKDLQSSLNDWIRTQNKQLPDDQKMQPLDMNGIYSNETEQAVKAYQKSLGVEETGVADPFIQKGLNLERHMENNKLSSETKMHIRAAYGSLQGNPAGQDNLMKLTNNREFVHLLSTDGQSAAVSGLMQAPGKSSSLDTVQEMVFQAAALEKNPAFQKLPDATKQSALNTIFYEPFNGEMEVEATGLNTVSSLVTAPEFGQLTANQQEQLLEIVRANPNGATAHELKRNLLQNEKFQSLDPKMQARVLDIAHHNTMISQSKGELTTNETVLHVDELIDLLNDPAFQNATESEQYAQLNAMKSQLPPEKGGQFDFAY